MFNRWPILLDTITMEAPLRLRFRLKVLLVSSILLGIIILTGSVIRNSVSPLVPHTLTIVIIIGILQLAVPFIFKLTHSYYLSAWIAIAGFYLIPLVAGFNAGGLRAPIMPLVALMPIINMFYLGARNALITSLVSFAILGLFHFRGLQDLLPPSSLGNPAALQTSLFVIYCFLALMTLVVTWGYENERQRSDSLQTNFLANVGHELRTPLTVISGAAKLLSLAEGQDRIKFEKLIVRNTAALEVLIADVLDAQKMASGRFSFAVSEFALEEFLNDVKDHYPVLQMFFPKENPILKTDPVRMRQIVFNLIDNAAKYADLATTFIMVKVEENQLIIIVEDHGAGISPEKLPDIFERFHQIPSSKRGKSKGVGLGLHIVKQLVDQMGGKISVASTEGVGTTFTVRVPVVSLQSQAPQSQAVQQAAS